MKISLTGSVQLRIENVDEDCVSHHDLAELDRAVRSLSVDRQKLADAMTANFPKHLQSSQTTSGVTVSNPIVKKTIDEITKTQGVVQSATKLIGGIKQMIADAVAAAIANGATADELQPVSDVVDALDVQVQALSDAVAANPAPTPPVTP